MSTAEREREHHDVGATASPPPAAPASPAPERYFRATVHLLVRAKSEQWAGHLIAGLRHQELGIEDFAYVENGWTPTVAHLAGDDGHVQEWAYCYPREVAVPPGYLERHDDPDHQPVLTLAELPRMTPKERVVQAAMAVAESLTVEAFCFLNDEQARVHPLAADPMFQLCRAVEQFKKSQATGEVEIEER